MIGACRLAKNAIKIVLNVPAEFTMAMNASKQSSIRVLKYFKKNEPNDRITQIKRTKFMHVSTNWVSVLHLLGNPLRSGYIFNQIRTCLVVASGSILKWMSKLKMTFIFFYKDEANSSVLFEYERNFGIRKIVFMLSLLMVATGNNPHDWISSALNTFL